MLKYELIKTVSGTPKLNIVDIFICPICFKIGSDSLFKVLVNLLGLEIFYLWVYTLLEILGRVKTLDARACFCKTLKFICARGEGPSKYLKIKTATKICDIKTCNKHWSSKILSTR